MRQQVANSANAMKRCAATALDRGGESIRVRGVVQGVGFRPTVWRLARDCDLAGDVCNDAEGVLIHAFGARAARERFVMRLRSELPPLARLDAIEREALAGNPPAPAEFLIAGSKAGQARTGVAADASVCAACLQDIRNPRDRRFGYPFTNCTHCGPRLSIIAAVPYDRGNTSMRSFVMCKLCQAEYDDPADRRFHAQPNACPACGPTLSLEVLSDELKMPDCAPLEATGALLRDGCIVAIKGIGGFHLACDASNARAVDRLRRRKHRYHKPFALMAKDVAAVRRYCSVNSDEHALLASAAAPIVLLPANGNRPLPAGIAPGHRQLGFMLPYSPLHELLLAGLDNPIVLTSGNRSDEPQCISNTAARQRLDGIADALLLHDRDIVNRVDDSVVRRTAGRTAVLRRARGYAPQTLRMPGGFVNAPQVLACGGELKNTFCLLKDGEALLSQHLGDQENPSANAAWLDALTLFEQLFEHRPELLAIDAHPEYLPSKFGRERAAVARLPLDSVQHHHAHIASCLADNAIAIDGPPVLGIALDGTGYGDDDTIWGGEFLLADYRGYRRLATFRPVAMPGGAQAILQPWRMAYAHLRQAFPDRDFADLVDGLPIAGVLLDYPLETLERMICRGFNSPMTSSCGRLFDAVAATIGRRTVVTYEGQAAIELEAIVDESAIDDGNGYPFELDAHNALLQLDPGPMWCALLADLRRGASQGVIAARFHTGLALALAQAVVQLNRLHGDAWHGRVALSGGVFQNALLTELLQTRLEKRGYQVLRHRNVPASDGGLSLGQAAVAAARALAAMSGEEFSACA